MDPVWQNPARHRTDSNHPAPASNISPVAIWCRAIIPRKPWPKKSTSCAVRSGFAWHRGRPHLLNYGNATAQTLWEMSWEELTRTPSRYTAETPEQERRRSRLLSAVMEEMDFIDNVTPASASPKTAGGSASPGPPSGICWPRTANLPARPPVFRSGNFFDWRALPFRFCGT